jgi:hypothetical protein
MTDSPISTTRRQANPFRISAWTRNACDVNYPESLGFSLCKWRGVSSILILMDLLTWLGSKRILARIK